MMFAPQGEEVRVHGWKDVIFSVSENEEEIILMLAPKEGRRNEPFPPGVWTRAYLSGPSNPGHLHLG